MSSDLVETWRHIIIEANKSWVLFKNGTCVILPKPDENLEKQAVELMKEWGPVYVGTPAGDFDVIKPGDYPGWVVTCHHPDILTYVAPGEVEESASDVVIGLLGRSKRHQDAQELEVLHVEDKRKTL